MTKRALALNRPTAGSGLLSAGVLLPPAEPGYDWSYVFASVHPETGTTHTLILPVANTSTMQLYLDDFAASLPVDVVALLVLDGASWHRSPQPVCDTAENDAHLASVPGPAAPRLTVPQGLSQVGAELGAPDPNRLVADVDASLEQQLLHVPVREQEAVVKVHRVGETAFGKR